mgnify:CR=1 FL=1
MTAAAQPMRVEPGMVSVIVPTFNRAALCARAVRSALAQTWRPIEIIVVDDGSSDDTAAMLREAFGNAIVVIQQANQGVSAARNTGIDAAHGEFVAFLDSDDEWLPEKIARQVEWLRSRPDFGMVLCDLVYVTVDGCELGRTERRRQLPRDGLIVDDVLLHPALVPSTVLLRREILERCGSFDTSLPTAEDLDFHLRTALCTPIGLIEEPLVRFARGQHSSLSMLERTNYDHVFVIMRFIEAQRDRLSPEIRRYAMFNVLLANARSTALDARTAESVRFAIRSLRFAGVSDFSALVRLIPLIGISLIRQLRSMVCRARAR